jgi:tetratricopeptide (TPR) repeat protein
MHKKVAISLLLFVFILPYDNRAQDARLLLKEAQQLEAKFSDKEALHKYIEILRSQPNHFTALCKSSELHALLGRRQPTKEKQADYYNMAKAYAEHAIRINPAHAESNFVMAFALGRIALISSSREEKINAVKDIKTYAEKAIQLDPSHYKAYHVLGKWHYEVSDLSSVEKWLLKVAYGSLPKSSLDMAIRNYEKSKQLNPGFLLNYLSLAKAYKRKEEDKKAIELLTAMLKLPPTSSNDATIKAEGKQLLEDLR